jgi:hypothetical protein
VLVNAATGNSKACYINRMRRILITLFFAIAWVTLANPAGADGVRKLATEPRRGSDIGGAQSLARLDFYYGDIRAWLLQDGNWHIEGSVQHRGALCGTYQLGIQFGIGNPGCANVEWIGMPIYVTKRRQCNSALIMHVGGDQNHSAADAFDQISCAQRLINCSGRCN